MFVKLVSLFLVLSMLCGCATMHRHPKLTEAAIITVGVGVGVYMGYRDMNVICHYDSQNVGRYPRGHCPTTDPKGSVRK